MIADRTGNYEKLIVQIGIGHADVVLDAGCGSGEKTFFISQHIHRIVGMDPDKTTIRAAQKQFVRPNLVYQVGQPRPMVDMHGMHHDNHGRPRF